MADTRFTLRFEPKLRARLRQRAKLTGSSESEIVRRAVEKELASERKPPSRLALLKKYTRFVGSAKGLPADSSTNPKYLEGFGESSE